jgi:bifunctional DNase/RNase
MKKIQLEILGLSSSQSQSGSFALILGEKNGNRRLPIIIGMFEAQSIAIQIEKISPNRPSRTTCSSRLPSTSTS